MTAVAFTASCASTDSIDDDMMVDRCAEASAALEECMGELPADFVEACENDQTDETLAIVDELLLASDCENADTDAKEDGLLETAFVGVCAPVVGAAFLLNRARSPAAMPLDDADKARLRPFFGSLVDLVVVSWEAQLVDEWKMFGFKVQFEFDVLAQTFGRTIFYDHAYRQGDIHQLAVVGHELTHTRQSEERGGLVGFSIEYCRAFFKSGFSYENNALEIEAANTEAAIGSCLTFGSSCP